MRQFVIATLVLGAILTVLSTAAAQTLRLGGGGILGISSGDLLGAGTLQRLKLQQVSVGGRVVRIDGRQIDLLDRRRRRMQIEFVPGTVFLVGKAPVTARAIEIGAHLTVEALPSHGRYLAFKVRISPHHRAIGGRVISTDGLLEIADHHGSISLVRVLPGAAITANGKPARGRLSLQMRVLALAYRDPGLQGVYLADTVHVLAAAANRWGGIIRAIEPALHRIAVFNRAQNRTYMVEIRSETKVTLNQYVADYADMREGDHVTVIGKLDLTAPAGSPAIVARYVRISSPSFGGVIAAIAPAPAGAVVLTVRAHHGHVLRIDAAGLTQVYMKTADGQQNAHVLALLVGEHISAHGKRAGKFELAADSIHVYPHTRTFGGTVASILPGRYRLVAADGSQAIVHTSTHTTYTLNGKRASAAAVRVNMHIRVRGYDALLSDQRSIPTLIGTHVSIIVHQHAVHHRTHSARNAHSTAGATPLPSPTPGAARAPIAPASSDNAA